jgi:hypothetical protein
MQTKRRIRADTKDIARETLRRAVPKHRADTVKRVRQWRYRNPEKVAAIYAVAHAVNTYAVVRGRCEKCGTNVKVCGFHDDYTKPLSVKWRCRM